MSSFSTATKGKKIAIIDPEKCKPNKCNKECIKFCPPQSNGTKVIEIEDIGKPNKSNCLNISTNPETAKRQIAKIAESLCIGCNICTKKCPFDAIKIINLPYENKADIVHRYGFNGFKLYGLPIMKPNNVIGIIGSNGIGKSTLVEILSDLLKPNFEQFDEAFDVKKVIAKYRGTVLQTYLKDLYESKLKFGIKFQKLKSHFAFAKEQFNYLTVTNYIELIGLNLNQIITSPYYLILNIDLLLPKKLCVLSGGELQKLMCWLTAMSDADVYIFDEPSNYLDVKQRLQVGALIQSLKQANKYVLVIEHDLSMMDYISDELYILYGVPGAYGIVSKPLTVLEGINMYLKGFISTQNIRFREEEYDFKLVDEISNQLILEKGSAVSNSYTIKVEPIIIEFDNFKLIAPEQNFKLYSSINLIIGENGTGKTTYIKYLAKSLGLIISVKDQNLDINLIPEVVSNPNITVEELFYKKIMGSYTDINFCNNVIKPLEISQIQNCLVSKLSGGELQKVMIILCLGYSADVYLIDEPSAHLDIDKRLKLTKIIRNHILTNKKSAFIIEHDIMMAVALSSDINNRIIMVEKSVDNSVNNSATYSATDSVDKSNPTEHNLHISTVSEPMDFTTGINYFLKSLNITMRTSQNGRPRINKKNSQLDQNQKSRNAYYE
jgi:ATP-binding cassette subfamily E protein 1